MRQPLSRPLPARLASAALAAALTLLTAACGDDDPPTTATGAITVALSASTLTVAQGGSGTATVTVGRSGGFSEAVALTAEGAPAGVTVAFAPASVPAAATASTLTATATGEAAAGTYPITVRATGPGVPAKTAQLSLTVTAAQAPAYAITVSPASLTVAQGARDSAAIQIVRAGGFAGPVTLTLSGIPEEVAREFSRSPVPDDTSTVKFQVGAAVPPGEYAVAITGTADGLADRTAQLSLTVTARSGGTSVTFSYCAEDTPPIWVGTQDGDNAWQRVTAGTDGSYSLTFFSERGGIASVEDVGGGQFELDVFYAGAAELQQIATSAARQACNPDPVPPSGKTVNGSVANVGPDETASIALGSSGTTAGGLASANFTLPNVPEGPRDLIAARRTTATFSPNAYIVRRGINPANGSTLPVLDFNAAEAFAPAGAEVTVSGVGGDDAQLFSLLTTANGTGVNLSFAADVTDGAYDYFGFPADKLLATDLQQVLLLASTPGDTPPDARMASFYFRGAANGTLALGPKLTPTVTSLATTPSQRLRTTAQVASEYDLFASVGYAQEDGNEATVSMTSGYRGSTTSWTLDIPDLSGTAGYNAAAWGLSTGTPVAYTMTVYGGAFGFVTGAPPADGDSFQFAAHRGTFGGTVSQSLLRENSLRLANRYFAVPQPPQVRQR